MLGAGQTCRSEPVDWRSHTLFPSAPGLASVFRPMSTVSNGARSTGPIGSSAGFACCIAFFMGANARNTSHGARFAVPLLVREVVLRTAAFPFPASRLDLALDVGCDPPPVPQLGLKVHHMLASIATGALFYHLIDRVSSYRLVFWWYLRRMCLECRGMSAYYVVPRVVAHNL
ncbi:hypothetical protein N7505_001332 [Penicillium chrysogenum]|uniref:Uncharacterized protein n=1 Tax=Penicillium chrysogenum TaxID=5076 RepID=A0ABQ8WWW7_PENCH|nr:hypothetical protein N7505_001332 [Penicillium chrysogenum]